jgi:hypothetical protein
MQTVKAQNGISLRRQAQFNHLSMSTFYRRRSRMRRNQPIRQKPGPKKIEFDLGTLFGEIRELPHGPKRTGGLGRLHDSWKDRISRRDIRELARLVRWEVNQEKVARMRRIEWLEPGTVWSIDDTHIGYDENGYKLFNTTAVDLASKYTFPPILGTPSCGAEIAGYLDQLCSRYGPPLFLKRDLGSNLNSFEVQEVMSKYGIIPLDSPVHYPPYNGTVEHMNGEIKQQIDADPRFREVPTEHKEAYLASYIHNLNHKERRCLKGRHACQYFGNRQLRAKFYKKMRREIISEVQIIQEEILNESPNRDEYHQRTARRRACEQVMLKHGLIRVERTNEPLSQEIIQSMPEEQSTGLNHNRVSPYFAPKNVP